MSNSSRQRRVAVAILLSTLGLTGVLVAQGGTQLLAAAFIPLEAGGVARLGSVAAVGQTNVDPIPILRRNIFDSLTGDVSAPPEVETDDDEVAEVEAPPAEDWNPGDPPPPACEGSMRLVGAFVRMREPEDSFAAITDAGGESLLYQQGMSVDSNEILHIASSRVVLRSSGGRVCSLSMFGDQPPPAPPRPAVAAAPPRESNPDGLDPEALESGITKISDREYSIERSLVTSLISNQAALMRSARVIPHEENGQVVGVKLYGIRRSSLLGRLGIQNGDMLRTINGYDMTSPDTALEAYARLQSADRITISLARRGQDMSVDYSIR